MSLYFDLAASPQSEFAVELPHRFAGRQERRAELFVQAFDGEPVFTVSPVTSNFLRSPV